MKYIHIQGHLESLIEEILNWEKEQPAEKLLTYPEFLSHAKVLKNVLKHQKI